MIETGLVYIVWYVLCGVLMSDIPCIFSVVLLRINVYVLFCSISFRIQVLSSATSELSIINKSLFERRVSTYRDNSSVVEWAIAVRLVGGSIPSCRFFAKPNDDIVRQDQQLPSPKKTKKITHNKALK